MPTEDVSQQGEGYLCQCGEMFDNLGDLRRHLLAAGRRDGKGVHKSQGRVNRATGEIVMPPYNERTRDQKNASHYAVDKPKTGQKAEKGAVPQITPYVDDASQIKFVPRIYNCTFTPIMRLAQTAAIRQWGWRADMPFENFIDTIFYLYFKEHGITLGGYVIDDDVEPPNNEEVEEAVGVC